MHSLSLLNVMAEGHNVELQPNTEHYQLKKPNKISYQNKIQTPPLDLILLPKLDTLLF